MLEERLSFGVAVLHVMIIDDDPSRVGTLTRLLDDGFAQVELYVAESLEEARWSVAKLDLDVTLCTLALHDATSYQAVAELTRVDDAPPLIALAPRGDDEQATDMVAAGAQEYLDFDTLDVRALTRAIKVAMARGEATNAAAPIKRSFAEVVSIKPRGLITTGQWDRVRSGEIAPGVDVLGAVARFTEMMLTRGPAEPFEVRVNRALGTIGLLIDSTRLSIWELDLQARVANQFGVWTHPGHISAENALMVQSAPFSILTRDHVTCLRLGGSLELGYDDMNSDLKSAVDVLGARSMLFVPVTLGGDFWGVVTATDRVTESRRWGATIQLLLRTIGRVAGTVQRREDFDRIASTPVDNEAAPLLDAEQVAFELDESGAFDMLGASWTKLVGGEVADVLGRPLLAFVDIRDHAQLVDNLVPVSLGQSHAIKIAIRLTHGQGEGVWVELRCKAREQGGLAGTLHAVARPEQAEREGAARALRISARAVLGAHVQLEKLVESLLIDPEDSTAIASLIAELARLRELGDRLANTSHDMESGSGPLRRELEDSF